MQVMITKCTLGTECSTMMVACMNCISRYARQPVRAHCRIEPTDLLRYWYRHQSTAPVYVIRRVHGRDNDDTLLVCQLIHTH